MTRLLTSDHPLIPDQVVPANEPVAVHVGAHTGRTAGFTLRLTREWLPIPELGAGYALGVLLLLPYAEPDAEPDLVFDLEGGGRLIIPAALAGLVHGIPDPDDFALLAAPERPEPGACGLAWPGRQGVMRCTRAVGHDGVHANAGVVGLTW